MPHRGSCLRLRREGCGRDCEQVRNCRHRRGSRTYTPYLSHIPRETSTTKEASFDGTRLLWMRCLSCPVDAVQGPAIVQETVQTLSALQDQGQGSSNSYSPGSWLKLRQQCFPVDRNWPLERCQPCIAAGQPCSPSLTVSEARHEDTQRLSATKSLDLSSSKRDAQQEQPVHDYSSCKKYDSALLSSIHGGHGAVTRLLLQFGANPNETSQGHGTALEIAAAQGSLQIVQLLIEFGADVNKGGTLHNSALQAASAHGHLEVVQCLLDHGAKLSLHDQGAIEEGLTDASLDQDTVVEDSSTDELVAAPSQNPAGTQESNSFRVLGLGDLAGALNSFKVRTQIAQEDFEVAEEAFVDCIFREHSISAAFDESLVGTFRDTSRFEEGSDKMFLNQPVSEDLNTGLLDNDSLETDSGRRRETSNALPTSKNFGHFLPENYCSFCLSLNGNHEQFCAENQQTWFDSFN